MPQIYLKLTSIIRWGDSYRLHESNSNDLQHIFIEYIEPVKWTITADKKTFLIRSMNCGQSLETGWAQSLMKRWFKDQAETVCLRVKVEMVYLLWVVSLANMLIEIPIALTKCFVNHHFICWEMLINPLVLFWLPLSPNRGSKNMTIIQKWIFCMCCNNKSFIGPLSKQTGK